MAETIYAPILIITLDRYDHLRNCIESLAANKLAKDSELYIGLDYPPSDKYVDGWKKIKEYLPTVTGFKKVVVLAAEKNLNPMGNTKALLDYIRALGYKSFVITEDDNVFSPNYLEYANWGLKEFENDNSVFAVSGFKRVNVDFLNNNVYKYPRYVAWGLATWFRKYDKIEKYKDFDYLKDTVSNMPLSTIFTERVFLVRTILRMIKRQYILEDSLPSLLPKEERFCLYPKVSMVRNIGFDGSGLHCDGNNEIAKMYASIPLDDNENFVPHIIGPLYVPGLKKAYSAAYKRPFDLKAHIAASLSFLIYRFTKRFWRIY